VQEIEGRSGGEATPAALMIQNGNGSHNTEESAWGTAPVHDGPGQSPALLEDEHKYYQ
jgi:hypothetical protein